jgi:hypothetical protein
MLNFDIGTGNNLVYIAPEGPSPLPPPTTMLSAPGEYCCLLPPSPLTLSDTKARITLMKVGTRLVDAMHILALVADCTHTIGLSDPRKGYIAVVKYTMHRLWSATRAHPIPVVSSPRYSQIGGGGPRRGKISAVLIQQYPQVTNGNEILRHSTFHFQFQCPADAVAHALTTNPRFICIFVPLNILIPLLSRSELTHTARLHNSPLFSKLRVQEARSTLMSHSCASCPEIGTILSLDVPQCRPLRRHYPHCRWNCLLSLSQPS